MVKVQTEIGPAITLQVANRAEWLVHSYSLEETKNLVNDKDRLEALVDADNRHFMLLPTSEECQSRAILNQAMINYLVTAYGK